MLLKTLIGQTLKGLVSLLPLRLKESLKTNSWLLNFYAQTLRKSGLFYGFPTPKQYNKAYQKVFKHQQKIINQLPDSKRQAFDLVILVPLGKINSIDTTLKHLNKTIHVHIVSRKDDVEKVKKIVDGKYQNKVTFYGSPLAVVDTQNSIFMVYAGQRLHEDLDKVLYQYAENNDCLYVDKDWLTKGRHHTPVLLPDWNVDLQLTTAYIRTGVWFKNQTMLPCIISNHSQCIAEMMASIYVNEQKISIGHLPYSLIHETESRKFNYGNYANTLSDWIGEKAQIEVDTNIGMLTWNWQHSSPLVSIIIPTYNAKNLVQECIESILTSSYTNFEILLVDNNSDDPESIDYFQSLKQHNKVRVLAYKHPFNYSAINNFAVSHANGEVIALVNNDIAVIDTHWLENMVSHVSRDDIGCVGAKLLYGNGHIQHAGTVLGYGGGAGHAYKYFPRYHPGYIKRLLATHNYSAVTAACLLVKKADYEAVNGLNEHDLAVAFNDVDFCLKVKELGKRNLYCAETELYHYESVSRGLDIEPEKHQRFQKELRYLKKKWSKVIAHDPAYSPNLTLKRENFSPKLKEEFLNSKPFN